MFGFPPLRKPFHKTVATRAATRIVQMQSGRIYRMSVVREPELFICGACGEWTDDSDPCCGVGAKYDHDEVER